MAFAVETRIIRPHSSTTYAAYCYRSSVCRSVYWSVTLVSPAKRLDQSKCGLCWGLGWDQATMY